MTDASRISRKSVLIPLAIAGTLAIAGILAALIALPGTWARFAGLKATQSATEFRLIRDAATLDELLSGREAGALLVDLRDRADYIAGHIDGFDNIAWKDNGKLLETWIGPYRRDKQIFLICYGGNRSARAFELIATLGFTRITDFTPGWNGYLDEKGPAYAPATGDCGCPE